MTTGTKIQEWTELRDDYQPTPPRLIVLSTSHWLGIWNLVTRFQPIDITFKTDAAESFLSEAFFLGWDFKEDWSPLVEHLCRNVMEDWRLHARDGLIITNYRPKWFNKQFAEGKRMVYKLHETQESRDEEAKIFDKLRQLAPHAEVKQEGKFCGWDASIFVDDKRKAIVELKTRSYPKQFFNKNGLLLTKRKWDGLVTFAKTYSIAGILLLKTSDGLFALNAVKVPKDSLKVVITTNDRWETPTNEEAVIIPGLLFVSVDEVLKEIV